MPNKILTEKTETCAWQCCSLILITTYDLEGGYKDPYRRDYQGCPSNSRRPAVHQPLAGPTLIPPAWRYTQLGRQVSRFTCCAFFQHLFWNNKCWVGQWITDKFLKWLMRFISHMWNQVEHGFWLVLGWFAWFFMVPDWFFMVFNGSRLVFHGFSWF